MKYKCLAKVYKEKITEHFYNYYKHKKISNELQVFCASILSEVSSIEEEDNSELYIERHNHKHFADNKFVNKTYYEIGVTNIVENYNLVVSEDDVYAIAGKGNLYKINKYEELYV